MVGYIGINKENVTGSSGDGEITPWNMGEFSADGDIQGKV